MITQQLKSASCAAVLLYNFSFFIIFHHHPPRSSPSPHRTWTQWENPPWGAKPRFKLGPALKQADALPTELRRTLNWTTPHPNWATPHPYWVTPHHNWATPHPNWATPQPATVLMDLKKLHIFVCSQPLTAGRRIRIHLIRIRGFDDQKLNKKGVQVTKETFSSQKRTSSTSKHKVS